MNKDKETTKTLIKKDSELIEVYKCDNCGQEPIAWGSGFCYGCGYRFITLED